MHLIAIAPRRAARKMLRALPRLAAALAFLALPATGQSLFSPAISVNGDTVSHYELDQRAKFLTVLRAPGDPRTEARTTLIEDELRKQALASAGVVISEEELAQGMSEFAARANLDTEKFIASLGSAGIGEATFREFIRVGLGWRELMRARFLSQARPSDQEIDRALAANSGDGGVRVLLSEIIMPATPATLEQVQARAQRIAGLTSFAAFSAEARKHSATRTRANGGRMAWTPIVNLPPQLRPLILALAPGEVTAPLTLPNAVALFQLRDIEETEVAAPEYAAIEYATYLVPGGRTDEGLAQAEAIRNRIDVCDDLYGVALGQPEERLERVTLPPAQIPQDIGIELAKLDEGEVSTALTRAGGQMLVVLMLCGRTAALNETTSREDVASALTRRKISGFADSYLEQLRADARIIEE